MDAAQSFEASVTITARDIARATQGMIEVGSEDAFCTSVTTDSRDVPRHSLFVALKGENFDGAAFLRQAVESGATVVLLNRLAWPVFGLQPLEKGATIVLVKDTYDALEQLSTWHRKRHSVRVVGVTGSNGKTSTKEMTAAVLGGKKSVLSNPGNFNNRIGMPRALLGLGPSHKYAVMEMGMNAPGEIAKLAQIAVPDIGIVTNVHPVHLEGLKTLEAVAQAKAELIEALSVDGFAVLNADDELLMQQVHKTRATLVRFGKGSEAQVQILECEPKGSALALKLRVHGKTLAVQVPRPGLHNAYNAAAAAAVGWIEGLGLDELRSRLEQVIFPPLRMETVELGRSRLLVDCYNANPRSMQVALETLRGLSQGKTCYALLGDMRELGEASKELHEEIGRLVKRLGFYGLCAFGELASEIAKGAREEKLGDVFYTKSMEEAVEWAKQRLAGGAWMLLKGSRAMRLERIAVALAEFFGSPWRPGY